MKSKYIIAITIAACVILVGLGIFCTSQFIKNPSLVGETGSTSSQVQKAPKNELKKKQSESKTESKSKLSTSSQLQSSSSSETDDEDGSQKTAYLTFDDGPSVNTPRLLAILAQYKVKATFFVIGGDDPQSRKWMKMEADAGNTVGVHSWTHKYSYIYTSEQNFNDDFNKIENLVISATGIKPKFFRFPGGTDNTVSLKLNKGKPIMPKLLQDVEGMGFTAVDWNAGGMDAVYPVPPKNVMVNGVVNECRGLKKVIILLHDSKPHASSVEAVPEIITRLRAMGFTFKPLTSPSEVITRTPALKIIKLKK